MVSFGRNCQHLSQNNAMEGAHKNVTDNRKARKNNVSCAESRRRNSLGKEGGCVKPYVIQSFKSDRGETANARLISAQNEPVHLVEVPGTEIELQPEDRTVYHCGELTALTLSGFPAAGSFVVVFTSGAEAATLTVPQTLSMPADFTVEANMHYEISVRDGYALCAGWAVSGS